MEVGRDVLLGLGQWHELELVERPVFFFFRSRDKEKEEKVSRSRMRGKKESSTVVGQRVDRKN